MATPECDIADMANDFWAVEEKSFFLVMMGLVVGGRPIDIFFKSVVVLTTPQLSLLGIYCENLELVLELYYPSSKDPLFGVPHVVVAISGPSMLCFRLTLCLEEDVSDESSETGTEGREGCSMWNMRTLKPEECSSIDSSYSSSSHPANFYFFPIDRLSMLIVC